MVGNRDLRGGSVGGGRDLSRACRTNLRRDGGDQVRYRHPEDPWLIGSPGRRSAQRRTAEGETERRPIYSQKSTAVATGRREQSSGHGPTLRCFHSNELSGA